MRPFWLAPIDETLAAFHETLEAKFTAVNQRIQDGTNTHVTVTGVAGKRRWKPRYPSEEDAVNSPFYGQLPGIDIADLLWFVAEQTGCLRAFTHVLERYVKHEPDPWELLACVVAMGTNMGAGEHGGRCGSQPRGAYDDGAQLSAAGNPPRG